MPGKHGKEGWPEIAFFQDPEAADVLEQSHHLSLAGAERFLIFGTDEDGKMPPERKLLLVLNAAAEAL